MGYSPENTIISFEDAVRRGADVVEMDVQLSADAEIVVMHDSSVDRTTNGEGLVRDLPWRKIKTLDAGVWYGPGYTDQFVPCLKDVLKHFRGRKTARGAALGFIIELKTVRGSGGSLADSVVKLIKDEDMQDRCFVISFDTVALQEVRQADKHLPTGFLYNEEAEDRLLQAKQMGAHAIFARKTCISGKGVAAAHKAGLMVATWTANTKVEMKRMIACGVDAITTNYPDRLRALMS